MTPQPPATVVSGAPPAAAPPQQQPPAQQPPQQQQPDATALQRENEDLKRQNAEFQRTAEFWHGKATAKPAPAAASAAEPEDDTDLLEVLTTKGVKGLKEVLAKSGFVSRDEAVSIANAKAAQVAKETELLDAYPDLKNKDSDFFKATAQEYGRLKSAGIPEALAMELAAKSTHLDFIQSGKAKTKTQLSDEAKNQREADRLARIKAQSGDGGAPSGNGGDDDDELTPDQKRICAGMGISEDAYKKRAKAGVSMSLRVKGQ